MKQLIILMGGIVLGTVIFQMMTGDQQDSLKSTASQMMRQSVLQYTRMGEPAS